MLCGCSWLQSKHSYLLSYLASPEPFHDVPLERGPDTHLCHVRPPHMRELPRWMVSCTQQAQAVHHRSPPGGGRLGTLGKGLPGRYRPTEGLTQTCFLSSGSTLSTVQTSPPFKHSGCITMAITPGQQQLPTYGDIREKQDVVG